MDNYETGNGKAGIAPDIPLYDGNRSGMLFPVFADLFKEGVPTNLPIAVVDKDNTSTSRSLTHSLDAFGQTEIVMRTGDFSEARKAMQKEKYTVYFIFPKISGRKLLPEKSRYCRFIPTILIFFPVL